jgi:hypothetical protein
MAESTFWDESEFEFFGTLEDEDKLLYLYDLLIGEFAYIDIHNEMVADDKEMDALDSLLGHAESELSNEEDDDSDSWNYEKDRNEIVVSFLTEGDIEKIQMKGPTLDVLLKVSSDMSMNGMLLMNRDIQFDSYEPWGVTLTYILVGSGPPISVN